MREKFGITDLDAFLKNPLYNPPPGPLGTIIIGSQRGKFEEDPMGDPSLVYRIVGKSH
jgi:hypothetical protein